MRDSVKESGCRDEERLNSLWTAGENPGGRENRNKRGVGLGIGEHKGGKRLRGKRRRRSREGQRVRKEEKKREEVVMKDKGLDRQRNWRKVGVGEREVEEE